MRFFSIPPCRILWLLPLFGMYANQLLQAQSALPLHIQAFGTNQVQILWPSDTNYNVLEESAGLADPNGWQDVPDRSQTQRRGCLRFSVRET